MMAVEVLVARIEFKSFVGVTGYDSGDRLFLELRGGNRKEIIDFLTIEDKSVKWSLNRCAKNKKRLEKRLAEFALAGRPVDDIQDRLTTCLHEIDELKPRLWTEYYQIDGERLLVPIGMWWLAERIEGNFHLNQTIKPVYIDGLRDYQKDSIKALMAVRWGAAELATGLGKARLAASLCRSVQLAGKRACVIVPTQDLATQIQKTIAEFCGEENVTAASSIHKIKLGCDVLVAVAASAKKWIGSYDVIIVDESQHLGATTWTEMIMGAEQATHVWLLSATQYRSDGKDLAIHAFGGPIVISRDVRWGIKNGWLEDFDTYSMELYAKVGSRNIMLGDETIAARAYKTLVQNPETIRAICQVLKKMSDAGRMTMVMMKTVSAGKAVANMYEKLYGVKHEVASSQYRKPLKQFQRGETQLLISNEKLVGEGIDVQQVDSLIICTQHSAPGMTMQMVGRALRLKKGRDKKKVMVFDVRMLGYNQFVRSAAKRDDLYSWMSGRTPVRFSLAGKA